MKAIQDLVQEHRVIERGLALLAMLCDLTEREGRIPHAEARLTLEFLRHFADRVHHTKEESILFPRATERGMPRNGGPIESLLEEHQEGRDCLRAMEKALNGNQPGDFIGEGRHYVDLLKNHIAKEDGAVFSLIEEHLLPEDEPDLVRSYQQVDADSGLKGERLLAEFEAICSRSGC